MPRINFVAVDGHRTAVDAPVGSTVLEAAQANGVPMPGTCGGSLVCGTCHVFICAAARAGMSPPSEEEEDTLDLAFGVTADSRLGCQVKLTDSMDGLEIRLAPTMQTA